MDHLSKAYLPAVHTTATEESMDRLINNIVTITVDDKHWIERTKTAAIFVTHTLFQPLQAYEALKRDDPLSLRKLTGEGKPAERKNCLGWDINTHSLRLFLPK